MSLLARGVPLHQYSALEQVDFIENERQVLLREFGREAIHIMATAKNHDKAMILIERLRKIYFIEAAEEEKKLIARQADELIRLAQYAYRVVPTAGGRGALVVEKPEK